MSRLKHLYLVKIVLKASAYGACDEYVVVVSSAEDVVPMFADIAERFQSITHIGVADEDLLAMHPDGIVLSAQTPVI